MVSCQRKLDRRLEKTGVLVVIPQQTAASSCPPSMRPTVRTVSCNPLPPERSDIWQIESCCRIITSNLVPFQHSGERILEQLEKKLNIITIKALKLTLTTTVSLWIFFYFFESCQIFLSSSVHLSSCWCWCKLYMKQEDHFSKCLSLNPSR